MRNARYGWRVGAIAIAASTLAATQLRGNVVVDNFEEYTSTANLQASWPPGGVGFTSDVITPSLDTTNPHSGAQDMLLTYNAGNAPYFGETSYTLPGGPQNWSSYAGLTLYYDEGASNSSEYLLVRLFDSNGVEIGGSDEGNPATDPDTYITSGTTTYAPLYLNFSSSQFNAQGGSGNLGLSDVATIRIGIGPVDYGSGIIYVDDITLNSVPEPASISLCGLTGLAFLRRKRI
jgi:hypothetical protein